MKSTFHFNKLAYTLLMTIIVALTLVLPALSNPSATSGAQGFISPASAAWTITLNRLTPIPVDSGLPVTYELQIQCSAVAEPSCDNGQIVLDIPADILDVLDLTVQTPNPLVDAMTLTPTGATIDLIAAFPAGASGSILFEVETENGITPDGYTWAVDATVSGSNTSTVTAQSDGEAQATAELDIMKAGPLGFGDGQVVALGSPVRYYILPCDLNNTGTGDLWFESMIITDTLPAEVDQATVIVPAGATYTPDPTLTTGGTVTWNVSGGPLADDLCNANANYSASPYWVEVEYPTADATTIVTNDVEVAGTPIGATDPITATDDLTHTFDVPGVDGSITKGGYTQLDYQIGPNGYIYAGSESGATTVAWYVNVHNSGTSPMSFEVIEPVPCLDNVVSVGPPPIYDSNAPGDICANPAFVVNSIAVAGTTTAYNNGWRPEYTTNLGTTGVYEKTGTNSYAPVGLPAGELIAEIRLPATPDIMVPPGGQSGRFTIGGYVVANDHNGNPMPADTQVWNTATVNIPVNGTSATVSNRVIIIEPEIRGNLTKGMSGSGDTRTVQLSFSNKSTTAQPVVVTDLLPAGTSFIDVVKACAGQGCTGLDSDAFTWEVIPNYNGTGRELVRLTSNTGYDLASLSSVKFDFTVSVAGMSPGTHTNDAQGFTGDPLDYCEGVTWTPEWLPPSTSDTFDLDGDGDSIDTYCQKSASFTIDAQPAFLSSEKQVMGDNDTAFAGFPNVGALSGPGGTAEYQLTFSNDGAGPLTDFVAYDILPYVGDTGVSGSQSSTARDSDFAVQLSGPITTVGLPAGWVIEYSFLTDPCRPEIGGPACDPPGTGNNDWTTTYSPGATAFRINGIGADPLIAGSALTVTVPVVAPTVVGAPGAVAWNSFAVDTAELLPSEPPKVGLGLELSDISLEKNISPAIVAPGEEFNISITVYHDALIVNNPDGSISYVDRISGLPTSAVFPATNVVVGEILPVGMTIVPGSSPATYNEATNEWTIGDIYPGQSFTLDLTATADAVGGYINVVEVTANDTPDIDSFPADDDGDQSDDDEDNAVVVAEEPTIDIQKLVESSRDSGSYIEADASDGLSGDYLTGEAVRYRFVVSNTSSFTLTNVVVSDPLIDSFCAPATLTIATLAPGASQTIDCEHALGFTPGLVVNTATVNAEYDGSPITPDSDTAQVQVSEATGTINGVVEDSSGTGIGGVELTLTPPAGVDLGNGPGVAITTTTSITGSYSFPNLPPGDYIVTESQPDGYGDVSDQDASNDGDAGDSDTTVDNSITVTITSGENDDDNNFVEFASAPPLAVDDSSLGNSVGISVTLSASGNDSDPDGDLDPATVDFDPASVPGGIGSDTDGDGDIDQVIVPGEGSWSVDDSGNVTFIPEVGFTGDPTPIDYTISDSTGLVSNVATITIDYVPVAVDDSSTDNPIGTPVTVSVAGNDSLGDSIDPTSVSMIPPVGAANIITDASGDIIGFDVLGEGVWSVDPVSGDITFTPEPGFSSDPTPIDYTVVDDEGNVSNPATVLIDYLAATAVALQTLSTSSGVTIWLWLMVMLVLIGIGGAFMFRPKSDN